MKRTAELMPATPAWPPKSAPRLFVGGPLSLGRLAGARLTCPWHGWLYDVRTGQCLLPARGAAVATYPVRIDGGDIWVEAP